jgi:SMC interacting uncharacterized protein involved in chromosome segregation
MTEIDKTLSSITELIDQSSQLKNITVHLTDTSAPDVVTASYTITTLEKRIQDLISQIKSLDRKVAGLKSEKLEAHYSEEFKDLYIKHESTIKGLAESLSAIANNWDNFKNQVNAEKQYAYFKGELPTKKPAVTEPTEEGKEVPTQEAITSSAPIKYKPCLNSLQA